MNEDIIAIVGFFSTIIIVTIGLPLVRAYVRRKELQPPKSAQFSDARLASIEQAIESMSIEVERISEGQRFVTKLLAERSEQVKSLPQSETR